MSLCRSVNLSALVPIIKAASSRESLSAVGAIKVEAGGSAVPLHVSVTSVGPDAVIEKIYIRMSTYDDSQQDRRSLVVPAVNPPVVEPEPVAKPEAAPAAVVVAPIASPRAVTDSSGASTATAAPLTKRGNCRICQKRYGIFRKEKNCARCNDPACSSCITNVSATTLGWKAPKPICVRCLPDLSSEIRSGAAKDPMLAKRESMQVDDAIVRMLRDAESGGEGPESKCTHCQNAFSGVRQERLCSECERPNCSFCCYAFTFKSPQPKKGPVQICTGCLAVVCKRFSSALLKASPADASLVKRDIALIEIKMHGNLRVNKNQESLFAEPELGAIVKGKLKCRVCDEKFSCFVPPRKCALCNQPVCSEDSYDITVVETLLGGEPTCCKLCYPNLRRQLSLQATTNDAVAEDVRFAIADADDVLLDKERYPNPLEKEGVKEATLKKKSCPGCEQKFGFFYVPSRCKQCDRFVCTNSTCSGLFYVPKLCADAAVNMCWECIVKVDVALPPRGSVAFGSMNKEQRIIVRDGLSCRVCQSKFTFFLRPRHCTRCKVASCRNCVAEGVTSVALKLENAVLCRLCILECKSELERKNDSGLEKQLTILSEAYARAGGSKDVILQPDVLSPRLRGATGGALSSSNKAIKKVAKATTGKDPKLFCESCSHAYSILRKQKQCSECQRLCCGQCVGLFYLKSLGEAKPRYVCMDCLPKLCNTMAKHAESLAATDAVQAQRASKEHAAVSLSFAGNMFPPSSQSDFPKDEVAAINKGQLTCCVCKSGFNIVKSPFHCTECRLCVCAECCFHFRVVHLVFAKTRPASVCRNCWPSVADNLRQAMEATPSLWREGNEALVLGNYFLGPAPVARMSRLPSEAIRTQNPACNQCQKKFGVFRVPAQCSLCAKVVCPGVSCSGLLYVPSKSHSRPSVVCISCLPKSGYEKQPLGDFPPSMELVPAQISEIESSPTPTCFSCKARLTVVNPPFDCSSGHWVCRKCCRRKGKEFVNSCRVCLDADPSADAKLMQDVFRDEWLADSSNKKGKEEIDDEDIDKIPRPRGDTTPLDACSMCQKKFSQFRKQVHCSECDNRVCSNCSNELKFSSWEASRVVCSNCEAPLRAREVEASKKVVPAEPEPQPVVVATPPAALAVAKVESEHGCGCCSRPFGFLRASKTCAECEKECCNHCVGLYMLRTLTQDQPRYVCFGCLSKVLQKMLSTSPGAELDKRTRKEANALRIVLCGNIIQPMCKHQFDAEEVAGIRKLSCKVCTKNFDVFHLPRKCTECSNPVCSRCSVVPRLASRVLGRNELVVACSNCWSGLRQRLFSSSEDLRVRDHINRMVSSSDAALEVAKKPMALEADPNVSKQKCTVCEKGFRAFRPPNACGACSALVCNGSSCSAYCVVPSISSVEPVTVCSKCIEKVSTLLPSPGSLVLQYAGSLSAYQTKLVKDGAKCGRCRRSFDFFLRPYQCSTCSAGFCHSCSLGARDSVERTCKNCSHGDFAKFWGDWEDSSEVPEVEEKVVQSPQVVKKQVTIAEPPPAATECHICDSTKAKLKPCVRCKLSVCPNCSDEGSLKSFFPWSLAGAVCRSCLLVEKDQLQAKSGKKKDPAVVAIDDVLASMAERKAASEIEVPEDAKLPGHYGKADATAAAAAAESPSQSRLITMTLRGKNGSDRSRVTATSAFAAKAADAVRCQVCKAQTHACLLPTPASPCFSCNRVCCGGCASSLRLAMKGSAVVTICRECVPGVRQKMVVNDAASKRDASKLDLVMAGAVLDIKSNADRSAITSSSTCTICEEGFSLSRRPFVCGECKELVCQHDCRHLPLTGYLLKDVVDKHHMVCKSCWPVAKSKLSSAVTKGSQELREAAISEIEMGDMWLDPNAENEAPEDPRLVDEQRRLENAKAEDLGSCNKCQKGFDLWRHARLCCSCKKLTCPGSACGGNIFCNSADSTRCVFMCIDCIRRNGSNIEVAKKPSPSHRYPLVGHSLELVEDGSECSVCEKLFSFWRRPHTCSECEVDVCKACSNGDISSKILSLSRARVCKPCMPGLKTRIEELSAEDPRLQPQAKQDIVLIEKAMEVEPIDEGETITVEFVQNNAPVVKAASPRDVSSSSHDEEACPVCHKTYGVFRKKKTCANCDKKVCGNCSHEFKMPSLGWTEQKRICDPCLPQVLSMLDKVSAPSVQLQKDRTSVIQLMPVNSAARAAALSRELDQQEVPEMHDDNETFEPVFSETQLKDFENGTAVCSVCEEKLAQGNALLCGKCTLVVCTKDSANLKHLAHTLDWDTPGTVCSDCWPGVKGQLREMSSLKQSKEIIDAGDKAFGVPAVKKVPPLALPNRGSSGTTTGMNPVVALLSPRYTGPVVEACPCCPDRKFDWSSKLDRDVSKESSKAVTKKKLAEIAEMREKLLLLQKRYQAELAWLENEAMRTKAEEDHGYITVKLVEAVGLSSFGNKFFLQVDEERAPSNEWNAPFVHRLKDPRQQEVLITLTSEKSVVGSTSVSFSRIQNEMESSGATVSASIGSGQVKLFLKRGRK